MRFIGLPSTLLVDCKMSKVEFAKKVSSVGVLPEKTVSFTVQVICATSGLISGNDLNLGGPWFDLSTQASEKGVKHKSTHTTVDSEKGVMHPFHVEWNLQNRNADK